MHPALEQKMAPLASAFGRNDAAFFDIDGTVFQDQWLIRLMFAVADEFEEKRAIVQPTRNALDIYKLRRTYDYSPVVDSAVSAIVPFFSGLPEERIREMARNLVDQMGSMRYLFSSTLLQQLSAKPRDERGLIVAITGSPMEIAEPFCASLGFDLVLGVTYDVQDGRYTGTRDEQCVHHKGTVIDELASFFGLDLAECLAIGDSPSDIPMLDRVGHPFVLNPNGELLRYARKNINVVWVNDRQKTGVTLHHADWRGMFVEIGLREALPPYLADFPELPGASV